MNSSVIIDRVIAESKVFARLYEIGLSFNKCTLIRCAIALFLEELPRLQEIEILRRCGNRISTDKLLAEIYRDLVPDHKHKINRRSKHMTSISTGLTPSAIHIVNKIVASDLVQRIFQGLEEDGYIPNSKVTTIRSIVIRAAVCYFLIKIDQLEQSPQNYQRVANEKAAEITLDHIYQTHYGGTK